MQASGTLEVLGGDTQTTVRRFLGDLMRQGIVDRLLVPVAGRREDPVTTQLLDDPAQLEWACPLAPILPSDTVLKAAVLSLCEGAPRIGAVLRPCQLRALREQEKLGRANGVSLLIIGLECLGTYEPDHFQALVAAMGGPDAVTAESLRWAERGGISAYRYRTACQVCETPAPFYVDVAIGFIGMDPQRRMVVRGDPALLERLGLAASDDGQPVEVMERLVQVRRRRRDRMLADIGRLMADPSSLLGWLARCTACRRCVEVCPVREAAEFSTLDREARWAGRTTRHGGLLEQGILFGRWMAACVGCGLCESACPARLPLTALFTSVAERVQEQLGYVPGRSLGDPLPWDQRMLAVGRTR